MVRKYYERTYLSSNLKWYLMLNLVSLWLCMLSREQFFLLWTGFASESNTESHGPLKPEARFYNVKPTEIRFRSSIIRYKLFNFWNSVQNNHKSLCVEAIPWNGWLCIRELQLWTAFKSFLLKVDAHQILWILRSVLRYCMRAIITRSWL